MAVTETRILPPEFIEAAGKTYLGDLATATGQFKTADLSKTFGPQFVAGQDPVLIGEITQVNSDNIHVTPDNTTTTVPSGAFILFKKDGRVNKSGLKGYYLQARFTNNSPTHAELFSVGTEISESSK